MADNGMIPQPAEQLPDGARDIQRLRTSGQFNDQQVEEFKQQRTASLLAGGFKPEEVRNYWGDNPPQVQGMDSHVYGNLYRAGLQPKEASNPLEVLGAGWDMSVTGMNANLMARDVSVLQNGAAGERPLVNTVLPNDANWADKLLYGAAQTVGDLPWMLAGAAAAPGATGLTGKGFLAGGLPTAMRHMLIESYNFKNPNAGAPIMTAQDFFTAARNDTVDTVQQGAIMGLAGKLGGGAAGVAERMGTAPLFAGVVDTGTMAASATALGSAMQVKVPDASDFTNAAILALGFHFAATTLPGTGEVRMTEAGRRVASNLQRVYQNEGITPQDALALAERDPIVKQEIFAQDPQGDPVTPTLKEQSRPEPEGYHAEPTGTEPAARPQPLIPMPKPREGGLAANQNQPAKSARDLIVGLEGGLNPDHTPRISPAGAIGEHQIMIGTARMYGLSGSDVDIRNALFHPEVNRMIFEKIMADLEKRYPGNANAQLIAYNAGQGRANAYMTKGQGSMLEAVPDKTVRGGIRYTAVPSVRDESFLPMETQKYLANGRRRSGGTQEGPLEGHTGGPTYDASATPNSLEAEIVAEEKATGTGTEPQSAGAASTWAKATDNDLTDEILSNVGEQRQPFDWASSTDRFMSQWVSELTPARRVDDRLVEEGLYRRDRDMGFEDQFRQTYASDSRASAFVRYGAVDPRTREIIPDTASFKDAARAMKEDGGNVDEWKAYMLANRTVEKATPVPILDSEGKAILNPDGTTKMSEPIETGFNPFASREIANRASWKAKYGRATDLFNDVNDSFLDYMNGSGMLSDAQVEAMRAQNETYVSMRRIRGDDAAFKDNTKGRSFGLSQTLKKMEGSDRQIVDPFIATFDNIRVGIGMADKNMARTWVVDRALNDPRIAAMIGLKREGVVDPNDDDIEKALRAYGFSEADMPQAKEAYEGLIASRQERDLSPQEFMIWREGQAEKYSVEDPQLAGLLRNSNSVQEADGILRVTAAIARIERTGIITLPDFPVRVGIWHQFNQWIMDPAHPTPILTLLRGLPDVISNGPRFQSALTRGAMGSALVDMGRDWVKNDMEATFEESGVWDRAWNMARHPLEFAELINTRIDAANRTGYTMHAESLPGMDPLKAATMARKGGIDYAERAAGTVANTLAKNVAFWRPRTLGLKQGWEAFADQGEGRGKAAFGVISRALLGITMPVIAMYAANYFADQGLPEGQRWADLPQWERDTMLITPPIGGVRIKLRLPANFGLPFGGFVNRALDMAVGDAQQQSHALDNWFGSILKEYNPMAAPTFLQAPAEVLTNTNFSTGRPLISDSVKERTPDLQYTDNTTVPAKALATVIGKVSPFLHIGDGVSPVALEHLAEGWGGPLTMDAVRTLNIPFEWNSGKPFDWANVPVVRGFVVRHPGFSSQRIEDFYADYSQFRAQAGDFSFLKREAGATGQNIDLGRFDASMAGSATHLATIGKALSGMREIVDGIEHNDTMTPNEKRQHIENIYSQAVVLAQGGSAIMDVIRDHGMNDDAKRDRIETLSDALKARLDQLQDGQPSPQDLLPARPDQ